MAKHPEIQGAEHDFRAMPFGGSDPLCHHPLPHQCPMGEPSQAIYPIRQSILRILSR